MTYSRILELAPFIFLFWKIPWSTKKLLFAALASNRQTRPSFSLWSHLRACVVLKLCSILLFSLFRGPSDDADTDQCFAGSDRQVKNGLPWLYCCSLCEKNWIIQKDSNQNSLRFEHNATPPVSDVTLLPWGLFLRSSHNSENLWTEMNVIPWL